MVSKGVIFIIAVIISPNGMADVVMMLVGRGDKLFVTADIKDITISVTIVVLELLSLLLDLLLLLLLVLGMNAREMSEGLGNMGHADVGEAMATWDIGSQENRIWFGGKGRVVGLGKVGREGGLAGFVWNIGMGGNGFRNCIRGVEMEIRACFEWGKGLRKK
jgi:hypothetical protein